MYSTNFIHSTKYFHMQRKNLDIQRKNLDMQRKKFRHATKKFRYSTTFLCSTVLTNILQNSFFWSAKYLS